MRVLGSFLGHDIVSIDDGPTHPIPIVEFNSARKMICRSYTGDTIADENSEIEISQNFMAETEKGVLKEIANQIGFRKFAISEDVLDFIDRFCNPEESDELDLADDDYTADLVKRQEESAKMPKKNKEPSITFKNEDYEFLDSMPEDSYDDSDIDPNY